MANKKTVVGIPKEIKSQEFRLGLTPGGVRSLVQAGHEVYVEQGAGASIGFTDEIYKKNGAKIAKSAKEIYQCEMIIKVKEPQPSEYPLLKEGQVLFCYLHLAPDPQQTENILKQKIVGIAFETVTDDKNQLPLLVPMSEVAGRVSIQAGANALQMNNGGKGVLLGGIPGVRPGKVLVFGGGIVGTEALRMALGLGADVMVFDINLHRLRELDLLFGPRLKTMYSTADAIEREIRDADLIIGAVLIPGAKAPRLIRREHLKMMQPGTVIVDVSIDQGGFAETSKVTTHASPTFVVDGVLHYCVPNIPASCARTSTQGLTNAILPYALRLANLGYRQAMLQDRHLMNGLNVYYGKVTNQFVAHDLGYEYTAPESLLKE